MIYDVAIIGAGVTGGLTAAALAKYKPVSYTHLTLPTKQRV